MHEKVVMAAVQQDGRAHQYALAAKGLSANEQFRNILILSTLILNEQFRNKPTLYFLSTYGLPTVYVR